MKKLILLSALLITICSSGQSIFEPLENKLSTSATFTEQEPKIDGILNEKAWGASKILRNFVQVEPNQGQPSKFNTTVKILYDRKYLYVGVFCEDPDGLESIRVPDMSRDFSFRNNDTFAIGIDGFKDGRNSMTFATNPYGAQKDYLSFDDTYFDMEWNGLWKVRTSRNSNGWIAEFQIPWKTIRYGKPGMDSTVWGINFVRQRRKSNEISTWSSYPRAFGFNRSEYFGILTDVKPPEPKTNIQVNPYVLSSHYDTSSNHLQGNSNTVFTSGGDIKWAISPNTLLDITINTDFAQAEVDRQVNNLSRFSVFFPERRQFFLENASLFSTGLFSSVGTSGNLNFIPFFSRRIGLDQNGRPIGLDGGIRLAHRSLKRNFGIMAIREENSEASNSNYNFIGRYLQNLGDQNRIGILSTVKSKQDNTNLVTGIDGFFRINNSNSVETMAIISTETAKDSTGIAGYARYRYDSNLISAWWTSSYLGKDFNPELGFVSRKNVIATSPGIVLNYRGKKLPFKSKLRAFKPRLIGNWFHNASSGNLSEREISISPFYLEAQNGSELFFTGSFITQNIMNTFSILGESIATGKYDYTRFNIGLSSDPSSNISTQLNYEFGNFYNGSLANLNTTLTWAPIPHVNLKASFNRSRFKGFGVQQSSGTVDLYTIEGRFFLNPRINLSGLYQSNDQNGSDFYNIRFSWEYTPLSYIYLVFNSNRRQNEIETYQERQSIVKLSLLKQF